MFVAEKLILASESKYRSQILQSVGLKFEVHAAKIDEYSITDPSPKRQAQLRATGKAEFVAREFQKSLVLGFDQTLEFEGKAIDKANSVDEARMRLEQFSGKTHYLHSAVTLAFCDSLGQNPIIIAEILQTVGMTMRVLTPDEITEYVHLGEWQGCVGCYQAENIGANLFQSIDGDLHAIIGVPTTLLLNNLREIGINPIRQPMPPWSIVSGN